MFIMAVALASFASGGVAQTTCPTRANLVDGITLTRHDPFFSVVMTATAEGLAEARVMTVGGEIKEVSSLYSHPLTITARHSSDWLLSFDYQNDTSELDSLAELGMWSSPVTLYRDGEQISTGVDTLTFLGHGDLMVGSCSYSTWVVYADLHLEGFDPILSERQFAPELGLTLQAIALNPDGSPRSNVTFDAISAE